MAKKNEQHIKFEADVAGFKKNIEEAGKSIKTLNATLKLNKNELAGTGNSVELLGQRLDTLKKKYQEQNTQIQYTQKEYEKAVEYFGEDSREAENLKNKLIDLKSTQQRTANEIGEVNKKLITQSEKLTTVGKDISNYGDKISTLGDKLSNTGKKLSLLSAGITAVIGTALQQSISFESAWTGVTKTVDGTEEQMKELRQGIIDLSTQLPSAAEEIAGVAENAGQLGIKQENVLKFSKAMIDLGNSTNLGADEASTAIAQLYNVMGSDINTVDNFGSALVALGNNAATTERDILNMATRVGSSGKQIGLTEQQILALSATLASVGLEAEGGGSAISAVMTKIDKDVALNSKSLKTWANISGTSVKEFKKIWETDAMSAIQQIISGMGDASKGGENLNVILDELGVTSLRQTDTMKRLSTASELMGKMVDLSNKSWKENTALTEEANKRYETTESKLKKVQNEIKASGIALGDELKPILLDALEQAKPILQAIKDGVAWFNNLSNKTKDNVKEIGAWVVAAGPMLTIGGKIVKTAANMYSSYGKVVKGLGDYVTKIKIASAQKKIENSLNKEQITTTTATTAATKLDTTAKEVQTVATVGATTATKALKVAMLALPFVGIIAGVASLASAFSNLGNEEEEQNNKLKESLDSMKEFNEGVDKNMHAELAHLDVVSTLKDELSNVVDENGKVQEGEKKRAEFILGELNDALGTEYKLNGDLVEGYKELQGEIDKAIDKKKAEIILNAEEEKYTEALKNRAEAQEELRKFKEGLNNATEDELKMLEQYPELHSKIDDKLKMLEERVQTYTDDVKNYNEDYKNFLEGNYDAINNKVKVSTEDWTDTSLQTIKNSIVEKGVALKEEKEMYAQYGDDLMAQTSEQYENELLALANELVARTSTVNELGEDEKNAWKALADSSYEIYAQKIREMSPEMATNIQNITGVIVQGTPEAAEAMAQLDEQVISQLDSSEETKQKALETLQGYLDGLGDEEKRELLKSIGVEDVEQVMKGLKEGNLAEEQGIDILKKLHDGLNNSEWTGQLFGVASSISSSLARKFNITPKINNISLPGHKDGLDYVPYDNYVARLHKGERVLTAEENKKYMNENITNKTQTNNNIILNFYPQTMSDTEIRRISDTVNNLLGQKA